MAGEISTAGLKIGYMLETTAGSMPTGSYTLLGDYITSISGLGAEYEQYDVTPLAETQRHRFVKGLQGNDGSVTLGCNVNPVSRDEWNGIVANASYISAKSAGKEYWWAFVLPGDSQAAYIRGEPTEMNFPDAEVGQAVQGTVTIIENGNGGWAAKPTNM